MAGGQEEKGYDSDTEERAMGFLLDTEEDGPICYVLGALNFIFHLLTNTFSSHDLFPPPFHHMTSSPDCLPIILTM